MKGKMISFEAFPENTVGAEVMSGGRLFQRYDIYLTTCRMSSILIAIVFAHCLDTAAIGINDMLHVFRSIP